MNAVPLLMRDLEHSIASGPIERQEATLRRVTDLLAECLDRLTKEQVGIFDLVMCRLVQGVGTAARQELAQRLSALEAAPAETIRLLDRDRRAVAGPLLQHPPASQRPPAPSRSGDDEVDVTGQLAAPRQPARDRALVGHSRAIGSRAGALVYADALDTVGAITLSRAIDEEDVAGFAQQRSREEAICAVAACAGVSLATAEGLFTAADPDLIFVIARANGWSWNTARSLLRLRGDLPAVQEGRLAAAYDGVDPRSAQKAMAVLRDRDGTRAPEAQTAHGR